MKNCICTGHKHVAFDGRRCMWIGYHTGEPRCSCVAVQTPNPPPCAQVPVTKAQRDALRAACDSSGTCQIILAENIVENMEAVLDALDVMENQRDEARVGAALHAVAVQQRDREIKRADAAEAQVALQKSEGLRGVQEILKLARAEIAEGTTRIAILESALRKLGQCDQCYGKKVYMPYCEYCGDSTFAHDCPEQQPCPCQDGLSRTAREALVAAKIQP